MNRRVRFPNLVTGESNFPVKSFEDNPDTFLAHLPGGGGAVNVDVEDTGRPTPTGGPSAFLKAIPRSATAPTFEGDGANRARTGDLRAASATLSQLSYSPVRSQYIDGGIS